MLGFCKVSGILARKILWRPASYRLGNGGRISVYDSYRTSYQRLRSRFLLLIFDTMVTLYSRIDPPATMRLVSPFLNLSSLL